MMIAQVVQGAINDGGCPRIDTDKDGIVDSQDKCPEQPGPPENAGCPSVQQQQEQANILALQQKERNKAIKAEVTSQLNALSRTIVFNNGTAVLNQRDKRAIDEIKKIMESQPKMKFHIAGHTDSTGGTQTNLALSEQRAKSVKDYLVLSGINEERLTSQGYGEDNPIADNNTKEGRLANRRVEIFIVN
ncbi:OmpA family protein [Lacinutrix neustonica]|uniref:OmpA family protein n=1 Tax=Lacinutrix neustonica TaxID=2980107 RepID=A0A9E8MX82_9FLAO|nr:OmpA family protein [Lacinutrix neustonica]WAC03233.1 OmpA family protein [Lacinutrix neustonica]